MTDDRDKLEKWFNACECITFGKSSLFSFFFQPIYLGLIKASQTVKTKLATSITHGYVLFVIHIYALNAPVGYFKISLLSRVASSKVC